MSFTNIEPDELVGLGVTGLADTPELSTEDMQAQFDEYPQFLKDKFITHITELEAKTAAANIGIEIPTSLSEEVTTEKVQDVVNEMASRIQRQKEWQDNAENNIETNTLDADDINATEIDTAAFHADETTVTAPTVDTSDVSNNVATTEFVDHKMQAIGAGDMSKSVYDPNDRGMVERAYQVGDSYVNDIIDSTAQYPAMTAGDTIKVLVGKIKKYLADLKNTLATQTNNGMMASGDKIKLDGITPEAQSPAYGTCSTGAGTATKVITLTDENWQLRTGAIICVKFSNTNTAQSPKFDVNGTGAKSVWYNKALITDANISYGGTAGRPMVYMYDGTRYIYIGCSRDYAIDMDNLKATVDGAIHDMVTTYGAKNLIPYPYNFTTHSYYGITLTNDSAGADDTSEGGSITLTGTENHGSTELAIINSSSPNQIELVAGEKYILSGTGVSDLAFVLSYNGTTIARASSTDVTFTASSTGNATLGLFIGSGVSYDNGITLYPMLRKASIEENTYMPYVMTNKSLTKAARNIPWYATSTTAQSTTTKTATCLLDGFSLVKGAKVVVKFTYTNTATAPSLNVNGTGAKTIKAYGSTAPSLWWLAGDVVEFTFDGTYWMMQPTQGQVAQLNSALMSYDYELLGTKSDGTSIAIDASKYEEFIVVVYPHGALGYIVTIPAILLSTTQTSLGAGSSSSSQYGAEVGIHASTTFLNVYSCMVNGSTVSFSAKFYGKKKIL